MLYEVDRTTSTKTKAFHSFILIHDYSPESKSIWFPRRKKGDDNQISMPLRTMKTQDSPERLITKTWLWKYQIISLQARFAGLPTSPVGLLGRFAPSGFALASRLLRSRAFRAHENFRKKKGVRVSIDSKCSETRKNAKKNFFTAFDPLRAAKFTKIFEKISVSQSTRNTLKRIEMQKKIFLPLWHIARSSKREWQRANLTTPCHPQGPKECPCQVSCRLD